MKKIVIIFAAACILMPSIAAAAWWNPSTWKAFRKEAKPQTEQTVSTSTAATPAPSIEPTIDELKKRIAELEDKLEKALAQKDAVIKVQSAIVASQKAAPTAAESSTSASGSGLSSTAVAAKARPAIVLVETSQGSASGSIIDASGKVLTSARIILARDSAGAATGAMSDISVTLQGGSKKKATLVGVDEAADIAVIQIADKGSYNYLKINHDGGLAEGQKAYVISLSASGSTNGTEFVEGTIAKKGSTLVEISSTNKPFDTGGAVVNDQGGFIGIPNISSCKVLEEGRTCLKYTVTTNIIRSRLTKLTDGMRLYKDHRNKTEIEDLTHGELEAMYSGVKAIATIDYTVELTTDKNSFEYLNSRFGDDMEGKITKLYLNRLKAVAENIYRAVSSLKDLSYDLRTFLINENAAILELGTYQQKVLSTIQTENQAKLKEYTAKVDFWSKKKNEYDAHIANMDAGQNYLMEEALLIESNVKYLQAERKRIIETFSGENLDIF